MAESVKELQHVVATSAGPVVGIDREHHLRFPGIRFAAPPTGSRRFAPPEPVEPWTTPRLDDRPKIAPQVITGSVQAMHLAVPRDLSEDCLTLEVFTPACDERRRPVMVWLHGGAFFAGTGSLAWFDGATFAARHDVVVVSLNYRLGLLGWTELSGVPDGPTGAGNLGLLDQIAGLEWVRDEIARFGGDPGRVTLAGQSAGAMSVAALLGCPRARGLFHRGICQSGASNAVRTLDEAIGLTEVAMDQLGVATMAELMATDVDAFTATMTKLAATMSLDAGGGHRRVCALGPVIDGELLHEDPLDSIARGAADGVDLIVGSASEEWRIFSVGAAPVDATSLALRLAALHSDPAQALAIYRAEGPDMTPDQVWNSAVTDLLYRAPTRRLAIAQAQHADVYVYEFAWESPAHGGALGACHSMDIPFVFHTLDVATVDRFTGPNPPVELADRMNTAWACFIRTGDPNAVGATPWDPWVASSKRRPVRVFDEPDRPLGPEPRPRSLRLWLGETDDGDDGEVDGGWGPWSRT